MNPNPDQSGLKPVKKGEVRNPAGYKGLHEDAKELARFDKLSFARVVWRVWNSSVDEIKAIATNPKSKGYEAWLASTALKGIAYGDHKRLDWFCTRLGLPQMMKQMDLTLTHEFPQMREDLRSRLIRLVTESQMMQDPEIRKQLIDVTPQTEKNQDS